MKLKYILIAILCLNNQTIKSHDEIIEYGKIAALSIGTALTYELIRDRVETNYAPILHEETRDIQSTIINGIKYGAVWSVPLLVFSLIDDRWPQINAEQLVIPAMTPLVATTIVSLLNTDKMHDWLSGKISSPTYNETRNKRDSALHAIDVARDVSLASLIGYIINQRVFNK